MTPAEAGHLADLQAQAGASDDALADGELALRGAKAEAAELAKERDDLSGRARRNRKAAAAQEKHKRTRGLGNKAGEVRAFRP